MFTLIFLLLIVGLFYVLAYVFAYAIWFFFWIILAIGLLLLFIFPNGWLCLLFIVLLCSLFKKHKE